MGVYLTFLKKSYMQKYEYRANTVINIIGTLISLLVMVSIWTSLYEGNNEIKGITLNDMIIYVSVSALVSTLIYSNIGNIIGRKITDGSISTDMIKPVRFKYYIFANQWGKKQ